MPPVWLAGSADNSGDSSGGGASASPTGAPPAGVAPGVARMDDWRAVLADGATLGLQAGGCVATVLELPEPTETAAAASGDGNGAASGSGDGAGQLEGLTCCIEYPAPRADGAPAPTLLATQRWVAAAPSAAGSGSKSEGSASGGVSLSAAVPEWRLVSHRTIPFCYRIGAMACLRCDSRGCVAYNRNVGGR
jgi:hypothetical protein